MGCHFLTFILVSSSAIYSSYFEITDWDDVMVAREDVPITLVCAAETVRGIMAFSWTVKLLSEAQPSLILLVNEKKSFRGAAWKASMQLSDPNFQETRNFSLLFRPRKEDSGLYLCMINQQERKVKERIILLAVLTVTVVPAAPIPQQSTLGLIASVRPDSVISTITWAAPGGISLRTEKKRSTGFVAKLPQVQYSDNGTYVCAVRPVGNNSNAVFAFNVEVIVAADSVASFANTQHGPQVSTAARIRTSVRVSCPDVRGDFVRLFWRPSNSRPNNIKRVYQYDRWRGSTWFESQTLRLAGPPYDAEDGNFSFVLIPKSRGDGGQYICDVYLNDNPFSQVTRLSVMQVKTKPLSSKLELECLYSEQSQVRGAKWKRPNKSHRLNMTSNGIGSITTSLPLPITSDVAGNYTCTLELRNGKRISATHTVTLPPDENGSIIASSPLPSLSALLLLVPLVAAAVGVLLWRQKHISDRGVEQSLSVHSGYAENIYEDPEDVRQAPPQGSVYMDLSPRKEDDVYKELERYEQCQG